MTAPIAPSRALPADLTGPPRHDPWDDLWDRVESRRGKHTFHQVVGDPYPHRHKEPARRHSWRRSWRYRSRREMPLRHALRTGVPLCEGCLWPVFPAWVISSRAWAAVKTGDTTS
jgi:hypothetical protein